MTSIANNLHTAIEGNHEEQIDIVLVPDECPSSCQVLQASQTSAICVAAEAQSLFQSFLQYMHTTDPSGQFNPNGIKGRQALSHFTYKLDKAVANHFLGDQHCEHVNKQSCQHKQLTEHQLELIEQQNLIAALQAENQQLQLQSQQLGQKVEKLSEELSKRRTQYNNRILVQVFKDHAVAANQERKFFDIVPREQLTEFIPFVRNILLGPAIATQFDTDLAEALAPYLDDEGSISLESSEALYADNNIINLMQHLSDTLYSRAQKGSTFTTLLKRKFPIEQERIPALLNVFNAMGTLESEAA